MSPIIVTILILAELPVVIHEKNGNLLGSIAAINV